MKKFQWLMKSKFGSFYLVASEAGMEGLCWRKKSGIELLSSLRGSDSAVLHLAKAVIELEEYLKGDRKKFEVKVNPEGTPFQMSVWNHLKKIGFGKTTTYLEVARSLGNPKAVRAVGTAIGKNPVCILIPCHRVIASNGGLGGFSGGITLKKALLELEKKR